MSQQLNTSEEFVHWFCRRSFLSLWSYASPRGNDGKELCDILVVCDPDVIIISVKEIQLSDTTEPLAAHARWERKAVDDSVKQIYGAERWLSNATHVIRVDGAQGLPIPGVENRRIHRLAVAFGADGKVALLIGDHGKGYVHVLDERSFQTVLHELDTVSDFVAYLTAKEELNSRAAIQIEGEENLLAVYLQGDRSFPEGPDYIMVQPDLWEAFSAKPEVQARSEANRVSFEWDRLIESLTAELLEGNLPVSPGLAEHEQCLRILAREDRFCRRVLGKAYAEFVYDDKAQKTRSRMMRSPSGQCYVLLRMAADGDQDELLAEMHRRCLVARSLSHDSPTIIGIGITDLPAKSAYAIKVVPFEFHEWTEAHAKVAKRIQDELDCFRSVRLKTMPEDEYPKAPARRKAARPKANKNSKSRRKKAARKLKSPRKKK